MWNHFLDFQEDIFSNFLFKAIHIKQIKVNLEMGKTPLFIIPALLKMAIEGKYYETLKGNSRL